MNQILKDLIVNGASEFMVQLVAGLIAGLLSGYMLILYSIKKVEPEREAREAKREKDRIEQQNKREDELLQRETEAKQKALELKKINGKLLELYKPIEDAIIDFQKIMVIDKSKQPFLITNYSELETTIEKIKLKTEYEIDSITWECWKRFYVVPVEDTLNNVFLNRVQNKITELKEERKKYE